VADAHLGIQSDLLRLLHAAAASFAHSDDEVPILRILLPALPQSALENKRHPAQFWHILMLKMRFLLRVPRQLHLPLSRPGLALQACGRQEYGYHRFASPIQVLNSSYTCSMTSP
jgi:hypothetical protein